MLHQSIELHSTSPGGLHTMFQLVGFSTIYNCTELWPHIFIILLAHSRPCNHTHTQGGLYDGQSGYAHPHGRPPPQQSSSSGRRHRSPQRVFTDPNHPDSASLRDPHRINPWRHHLCNGPWFGCYETGIHSFQPTVVLCATILESNLSVCIMIWVGCSRLSQSTIHQMGATV